MFEIGDQVFIREESYNENQEKPHFICYRNCVIDKIDMLGKIYLKTTINDDIIIVNEEDIKISGRFKEVIKMTKN